MLEIILLQEAFQTILLSCLELGTHQTPGMHLRSFVLYPLYEIAPELEIPGRGRLHDVLAGCQKDGLERLE